MLKKDEEKVKKLNIKYFREFFMRNTLSNKINKNEVGIVNYSSIFFNLFF